MHRLHEVKQGKGLRQVGQTLGVLFHRLEVTLTVLNDVGDVLRFRLRVRQLRRSLAVQVIEEFHLTGVQGLYQLNSHSKLCHLVCGGSSGGGLGAPPGYAEFVTSAVRSAMEPFLQNMAQVVGEQTAQITIVNQRVEQLASVVSQMNLNYSSNVPVAGSNAANVGSPSPPRNQQSSSGLSSVSGFGERPPVSPVRNFGVPVMTAEGVPVYEGPGVAASRAEEREKDIFTKSEKWLPAMPLPDFSKWTKSRQEEILCFSEYMSQFRSWIALASDVFAFEIESAIRHPDELHMGGLKPAQQLRSSRLLAMLQQIFTPYPRAHMLIQAYVEGIGVDGIFVAHRGTSGFEALRVLGKEFSLRTRAEASFFRVEVMKRTYKAENLLRSPMWFGRWMWTYPVTGNSWTRGDSPSDGIKGRTGNRLSRFDVDTAEIPTR